MHDNHAGFDLSPSATRIRDAARSLIERSAFDEVTIAEVARLSGVNEVTVYRTFGSKGGLAAACWAANLPALDGGIRWDRTRYPDPVDRIRSHLRRLARVSVADRQVTHAMILAVEAASMQSGGPVGTVDPRRIVPLPSLCAPMIEDGQHAGLVRDDYPAYELAVFLTNNLLLRVLTRAGASPTAVSRFVTDLTIDGITTTHR